MNDEFLDTKKAAKILGLAPNTLSIWRLRGIGPKYVKLGRRAVRYRMSDLEEFVESQVRQKTA